jgi:hypothetical protein
MEVLSSNTSELRTLSFKRSCGKLRAGFAELKGKLSELLQ